jgi:hypothetical protein
MKVQLNPATRIQLEDGKLSEYGVEVTVSDELGRTLTRGANPCGVEVDPKKPARGRREE